MRRKGAACGLDCAPTSERPIRRGAPMLQAGDAMPEFTLRDSEREKFTDANLRGAIAVVAFYPMSFTGG